VAFKLKAGMHYSIHKFLSVFLLVVMTTHGIGQDHKVRLHALLIVGHQEDLTEDAKEQMNDIAKVFEDNGITTHKFYDDKADWDEIKKLSGKCSFLVYSGHGSTLGENNVGGICINSYVTAEKMVEEFRLKENALVCFQSVCLGAGSTAGDDDDIGKDLAKERVSSYAKPFLEIGASGYYANNYTNGVYEFLEDFLRGTNLNDAYNTSIGSWSAIEVNESLEGYNDKKIVIAARDSGGMATRTTWVNGVKTVKKVKSAKSYNVAYVGNEGFSIEAILKL